MLLLYCMANLKLDVLKKYQGVGIIACLLYPCVIGKRSNHS